MKTDKGKWISKGKPYRNIMSVVQAVYINNRLIYIGNKCLEPHEVAKFTLKEIFEKFEEKQIFQVTLSKPEE